MTHALDVFYRPERIEQLVRVGRTRRRKERRRYPWLGNKPTRKIDALDPIHLGPLIRNGIHRLVASNHFEYTCSKGVQEGEGTDQNTNTCLYMCCKRLCLRYNPSYTGIVSFTCVLHMPRAS